MNNGFCLIVDMEKTLFALFFKEPDQLVNWMGSSHRRCGLYIGNKDCCDGNIYLMWHNFTEYVYKKKTDGKTIFYYGDGFEFDQNDLEFVRIDASSEEITRLNKICTACCDQTKRTYNRYDKVLSVFSTVGFLKLKDDVDIYNAPELHNAQALLLILRAGLDPENNKTLVDKLKELNSREVYSTQLFQAIMDVTKAGVVTLT
jgi:hypothetical protein